MDDMTVHRFGGLNYDEEVLGPAEEEIKQSSRRYARRVTKRLKTVREGTQLQNIRSKIVGVATKRIKRTHPYVLVEYIQKKGRYKGSRRQTAWHADNVRIVK